ncbi:alginate lyase family protein [Elusimicrobiota bacterium]
MNKLAWFYYRIRKMPLAEIAFRIKEIYYKNLDRTTLMTKKKISAGEIDFEHIFCLQRCDGKALGERCPEEADRILAEADELLANRLNIFGIETVSKDSWDWHKDPKTQEKWPENKYWSDINIRDGSSVGGAKFVWELNRFYFFPVLGLAYFMTKEDKYASKMFELLSDWMDKNRYLYGINWTSCIELAVRTLNVIWGISYLKDYSLNELQKKQIDGFIRQHAGHIYRYPSKYSSCNNHALAESLALFFSGHVFKQVKEAEYWFNSGKSGFEKQVGKQVFPDGGSAEITTTYLSFVADLILLFKVFCDRSGLSYAPVIDERLKSAAGFICGIMDKNRNMPNIGDQDDAIAVDFGQDNKSNFTALLNSISLMYNLHYVFEQDIKTCILSDTEKKYGLDKKPATEKQCLKHYADSGLITVRDYSLGKEVFWCWNVSDMGLPPLYAHGHLDALSFYLTVDGQEVFVDTGTYLYHSGGKWRRYFRSNAAHNTVRINEEDSSSQRGDFIYGRPYKAELVKIEEGENIFLEMKVSSGGHDVTRSFQ